MILRHVILWRWLLSLVLAAPSFAAGEVVQSRQASIRFERTLIPSGAEIITLFCSQAQGGTPGRKLRGIPVLSVLRDTLDDADPENDRLRQVWIHGYTDASFWQRFVAALPFAYRRASPERKAPEGLPRPVVDLGRPGRSTVRGLVEELLQAGVLNDRGTPWRLASRSYRNNASDNRDIQIYQALSVLSKLEMMPNPEEHLTGGDVEVLGARLALATRLLGGLVGEGYLQSAWHKEVFKSNENRGSNWELLRQKAEQNGLYFEPLSLSGQPPDFALIWMEQPSAGAAVPSRYDGRFLGISNPFKDARTREWRGYSETWYFDEMGCRIRDGGAWVRSARMIPLALYALDHPHVPLLLIDLRRPWKPGFVERARRIATDTTAGLLRWTTLGNLQFTVAKSALFFVKSRHGSALDRSARLRAYAQLQHFLKLDDAMDPELRDELTRHVRHLGINPLDCDLETQVKTAERQYAELLGYAASPQGLVRRLERDRADELFTRRHSPVTRVMLRLATGATLGLYNHRKPVDDWGYHELDQQRRFAYHKRHLGRVAQSGLHPGITWRVEEVRRPLDAVLEVASTDWKVRPDAHGFLSHLLKKTNDETLRQEIAETLLKLDVGTRSGVIALSVNSSSGSGSTSARTSEPSALIQ
ncbi:MAG: hypothetical protein HXY20_05385 [Acidobacteria bacterium]|nr:hypothetical protein [Acidobacteriota bacterium]